MLSHAETAAVVFSGQPDKRVPEEGCNWDVKVCFMACQSKMLLFDIIPHKNEEHGRLRKTIGGLVAALVDAYGSR